MTKNCRDSEKNRLIYMSFLFLIHLKRYTMAPGVWNSICPTSIKRSLQNKKNKLLILYAVRSVAYDRGFDRSVKATANFFCWRALVHAVG